MNNTVHAFKYSGGAEKRANNIKLKTKSYYKSFKEMDKAFQPLLPLSN